MPVEEEDTCQLFQDSNSSERVEYNIYIKSGQPCAACRRRCKRTKR
jgi:hypothetical protein